MRKWQEVGDPQSCLNRANASEMVFTLLGRDKASPNTIRFWVSERLRLDKNKLDDAQIQEALQCAETMEKENP